MGPVSPWQPLRGEDGGGGGAVHLLENCTEKPDLLMKKSLSNCRVRELKVLWMSSGSAEPLHSFSRMALSAGPSHTRMDAGPAPCQTRWKCRLQGEHGWKGGRPRVPGAGPRGAPAHPAQPRPALVPVSRSWVSLSLSRAHVPHQQTAEPEASVWDGHRGDLQPSWLRWVLRDETRVFGDRQLFSRLKGLSGTLTKDGFDTTLQF